MTVRVCRACGEEITTPGEAVFLWHEEAMSGPGWDTWAHREHADRVDMVDSTLLRIMTRIWAAQIQG